MEFKNIKADRIILSEKSARHKSGEIIALAQSINYFGLLSPITVRELAHSDRYEIISGNKRFYACRLAGIEIIPCYVTTAHRDIARVALKRKEKQDFFLEADNVRDAMLSKNISAEEFANATGYTPPEILGMLRLANMTDFEREMVRRNGVSREIALEIGRFEHFITRTELLSEVVKGRLKLGETVAMCEKERRGKRLPAKPKAVRSPKFRDLRLFDNTISRALSILKEAGVHAEVETYSTDGGKEYKIVIAEKV